MAVCVSPPVRAADWYTGAVAPADRDAWIVSVDASTTLSSQGSQFAGATVTAAPQDDLLVSGPRVRLDGLIGSYRTETGNGRNAIGEQAEVAAMAGYAWVMPDAALSAFVGLNVRHNETSQFDNSLPSDSTRVGLKTALDYYARPTASTMIHATGSYSTTFNAYYGRVRAGFASVAGGYIGPEFALLGDDYYRQWRAGIHLSGMQFGAVQLGVSAGYLHDQASKGGLYTTIDLRTGF
ncbi:hypothetical protein GCM10007884_15810 [Methylobacterium brachythecii]|nr:hypothetical protein GCM10007884_15810 [Methylobacterium brachythecii]